MVEDMRVERAANKHFLRQRGQMRIVDRKGLKATACECYSVIRAEYERLLPYLTPSGTA